MGAYRGQRGQQSSDDAAAAGGGDDDDDSDDDDVSYDNNDNDDGMMTLILKVFNSDHQLFSRNLNLNILYVRSPNFYRPETKTKNGL